MTTNFPSAPRGYPYTTTWVQRYGGRPPFAWSISAGALPTGLAINSQGQVTGTVDPYATLGTWNFTVKLRDVEGREGTKAFTMDVVPGDDLPLPRMTWAGTTSVTVAAVPGEVSTTVRAILQDNKERTFAGTLTFDFANGVAENGLDAGAAVVSTWYYLYLVPTAADDNVLCLRASANAPAVGPAGYVNFRYIGAFFNKSDNTVRQFRQRGIEFDYGDGYDAECSLTLAAGKDVAPVSLALTTWIPATAAAVKCALYLEAAANNWAQFSLYAEASAGVAAAAASGIVAANSGTQNDYSTSYGEVPIVLAAARNLFYKRVGGAGGAPCSDSRIYGQGFTDGYLRR